MASRKISDFSAMTSGQVATADDYLPIVDVSVDASNRNKRITVAELAAAILEGGLSIDGAWAGTLVITAPAGTISPVLAVKGDGGTNQIHIGGDEFGAYLDSFSASAVPPYTDNTLRHEWYITGTLVELWVVDNAATPGTARGWQVYQASLGVGASVNWLATSPAPTGVAPRLMARSSTDTDVDLLLLAQNAGKIRFGTHSAIGAETVTGYITIKDEGGTTRKIAVVS